MLKKLIRGSASTGFRFGTMLRVVFFFAFFALIIVNAIVIGIEEKSIRPVIVDLGTRITKPVLVIEEESYKIIQNKGVYDGSEGIIRGVIKTVVTYADLFSAIFMIILWLMFLMTAMSWLPFSGDNSRPFTNLVLAVSSFYLIQVTYLAYINWYSDVGLLSILSIPIQSIGTFFQAIPFLIAPISDRLSSEDISGTIRNVLNDSMNKTISTINNTINSTTNGGY